MPFLKDFKTLEQNCEDMHITCPTEPEKRFRLRYLITNIKRSWAKRALHIEFNWECFDKWCGFCGFHSSAEIRGERETIEQ